MAALSHGNHAGGLDRRPLAGRDDERDRQRGHPADGNADALERQQPDVGTALTIDGTLNATNATIQGSSSYAFHVGSTATATPKLNINGLTVKNTDASGMLINANRAAGVTTFTRFDKVAFSNGTAGRPSSAQHQRLDASTSRRTGAPSTAAPPSPSS